MTCDEFRDNLSDFIDGELEPSQQAAADAHVGGCDGCALARKRMLRTVRFLRANAAPLPAKDSAYSTFAAFHRSVMDESYGRTPGEVLTEELRAIFARRQQQQANGGDA